MIRDEAALIFRSSIGFKMERMESDLFRLREKDSRSHIYKNGKPLRFINLRMKGMTVANLTRCRPHTHTILVSLCVCCRCTTTPLGELQTRDRGAVENGGLGQLVFTWARGQRFLLNALSPWQVLVHGFAAYVVSALSCCSQKRHHISSACLEIPHASTP